VGTPWGWRNLAIEARDVPALLPWRFGFEKSDSTLRCGVGRLGGGRTMRLFRLQARLAVDRGGADRWKAYRPNAWGVLGDDSLEVVCLPRTPPVRLRTGPERFVSKSSRAVCGSGAVDFHPRLSS